MPNLSVIDLSHYQTVTDVAAIKAAGVIGVIAKATEGTNYTDDKFAARDCPECVDGAVSGNRQSGVYCEAG